MSDSSRAPERGPLRRPEIFVFLGFLVLSSCAAAPFLIPAGVEFARNLLVTSNKNYGGKYSADMNQLMMRISTPYVAMGLPAGTPQSALIPPAMLQQQQQAMMNQGMPGQPGQAMQTPGYPASGYGQQPGFYDPNNPYMPPGTNVQAPAYGMNQQFGGQLGGQLYGQMGGLSQQPGYLPQQGLPPQPGYPAAAPGSTAPVPTPGYPQQGMPGYQQPMQGMPMQQPQMYQQPPMDPYQQQAMAGMQGYQQQGMPGMQSYQPQMMPGYQQQGMPGMQPYQPQMTPGYQQQALPGIQPYQQQVMPGYQQPVAGQGYGYQGQAPSVGVGYPGQIYPRSVTGPAEPVVLDVALVRQINIATGKQVELMQDGETLKGGPNGDRFKLVVRTNCECFVYIILVDGSGWAQPVFPMPNGSVANPMKPEVEQAFPEGKYWFTLDEYKGVETFFLVASPARRTDLEESLAQLVGQQRPSGQVTARVEEPAVIPNGYGKTEAGKATTVRDEAQQQVQVTALSYVAAKPGEDVRVTRWFNHQ
jgi:uncharacterized protein DUF4384